MARKENDLGRDPVGRLLFRLALPAIAAQLVNMLYNIVDRIYIGHIPEVGATALTGVGVTFPILMLIAAFSSLVGMGGAPRASIKMGEKDTHGAEKILGGCFLLLLCFSVVLTAAFLIFGEPLLLWFGASGQTLPFALDYMNIYVCGTVFVQMALGLNAFISSQGFAKESMLTVLIGAVINIALDPIFIFGFGMGVRGAALATVISQGVSCVWVLRFLFGRRTKLRLRRRNMRLKAGVLLPVLALGVSPFIMQSTESLLTIAFNSSLQKYGGDLAVGAMTILSSVMQMLLMPLMGLTQGAQPIIGYNFGARDTGRVKKTFRLLLISSLGFSTLCWLFTMLFPGVLASLFSSDASLREISVWAMRVYFATVFVMGAQIACQQTFIAVGQAVSSLFLALLRKIILLIPLILVLPFFFQDQVFGVLLAEPAADFLATAVTVTLFSIQFPRILKRREESAGQKS